MHFMMETVRTHAQQTCLNRLVAAMLLHNGWQQYEGTFLKKTVLNELMYRESSTVSIAEFDCKQELMHLKNTTGYMLENVMFTNESFTAELIHEIKTVFRIRLFDQRAKNNANYVVALLKKMNISSQFIGVVNKETSQIITRAEMAAKNYKRCAKDTSIFGVFL